MTYASDPPAINWSVPQPPSGLIITKGCNSGRVRQKKCPGCDTEKAVGRTPVPSPGAILQGLPCVDQARCLPNPHKNGGSILTA